MTRSKRIGVIIIGRNEGERLKRCLSTLPDDVTPVYVDSGSSDGSCAVAMELGIPAISLSSDKKFTAARGRNAGLAWFAELEGRPDYVQMLDGDCEMAADWLSSGIAALAAEESLAAVFGRLRERYPERSIYNQMCDDEWNVPIGLARSVYGNALFRFAPLLASGGYDESLIAGEETDLCQRIARDGWIFRRIDAEMALHDAAIYRFSQFWVRARRAGYAFAEHLGRNGSDADPDWRKATYRFLLWSGALPFIIGLMVVVGVAAGAFSAIAIAIFLTLLYPLQWLRMAHRLAMSGKDMRFAVLASALNTVCKFAQFGGATRYFMDKTTARASHIIEYRAL